MRRWARIQVLHEQLEKCVFPEANRKQKLWFHLTLCGPSRMRSTSRRLNSSLEFQKLFETHTQTKTVLLLNIDYCLQNTFDSISRLSLKIQKALLAWNTIVYVANASVKYNQSIIK